MSDVLPETERVAARITGGSPTDSELQRLFDLSLEMLCIAGTDGYFKRLNPAFEATLGYSLGELLSRPFIEFVHPEDREATLAEIRKLREGIPTVHFENRYRCKHGSHRWLAWTSMPQADGLLYCTALDVTEQKRAAQLSEGLLEAAPDAIVVTDDCGRIVLANALTEELFGYPREEIFGQPIEIIVPERFREAHRQSRQAYHANPQVRRMGAGLELVALRKDGREFPAEISLGPVRTQGETLVFCAVRDVSARKKMEQALRDREAQLLAAQGIQQQLLPRESPEVAGFDVAGASLPAEFTGGDHFDYLPMRGGTLGIVVGDVSGHEIGSALLMASAHAHLHSLSAMHIEVDEILARTNATLYRQTNAEHFITLLFVRLDPATRTLVYSGAGHPTGYVLDPSGAVKAELTSTALPLAVDPDEKFPVSGPVALDSGDLVVLLTDGLVEAQSAGGDTFGTAKVLRVVHENCEQAAADVIQALHTAVYAFSGGKLLDDITSVVIKVLPKE